MGACTFCSVTNEEDERVKDEQRKGKRTKTTGVGASGPAVTPADPQIYQGGAARGHNSRCSFISGDPAFLGGCPLIPPAAIICTILMTPARRRDRDKRVHQDDTFFSFPFSLRNCGNFFISTRRFCLQSKARDGLCCVALLRPPLSVLHPGASGEE